MGSMKDMLGDTPYPASPGWKAPGTSAEAARAMKSGASQLRDRVLGAIQAAGSAGLTADEAARTLGVDRLAIRPRLSELLAVTPPPIRDSGERRTNISGKRATVWVAS